ncbi:hypothetical protein BKH41_04975 [Helicobacter sp. 12S02232-10]|uniref:hypothetical protein n=1 Tax=Helicobacter sp. 12S02232-10 TaxID=1476197 RepID=UPI000BA5893B|nr:hypothetical protein [Helicobacter sp. 12S02232-10]PAF48628.1 hypothetical protein BKH41_04975 [Helicobacter sp. 12S02232-10]
MKKTFLIPLFFLLICGGCASYNIIPQNIDRYDKGVEIIDSTQPDSKVQIEISQHRLGGLSNPPLVIYIGAQILKGEDVLFDTTNLKASQNGQNLQVLTYRQILDSNYDFTDILQEFSIPTPTTAVNTNIITPIFYYGRGGFLAYNMLFNPFIIDDMQAQQMMQEQRQARKIMAANYLRKTTLSIEGKAKGGFVAISPKYIKAGMIRLKITLKNETHQFDINIQKR